MSDPKKEQDQDLNWQREHESDSLQKSERPDKSYMEDHNLCRACHGKKRVCELAHCPQRNP
jgi:hypothetical protein